ncbi:MAG: RNA polymerase subunit sigma-24 [Ectothiorhodospiraceae bacterium]|nr:RNA polymerase subunit sigma-24 [Ectothiorhodospiraceae bacterium]
MSISQEERKKLSKEEDRKFIAAALAGDQEAYSQIVKKYRNSIYHLIVRMIGYNHEAEDLTQEAFIKAFNSLASFNDEYAFSTWLYKIATNNCIDHLRKKKLQTFSINKPINTLEGETTFEIPDTSYEPDKDIVQSQQSSTIQDAIEKLPDKYRRVIIMRHQEEKSYEEIAEELDLPLGTVKAHIFRAREMLYKNLRGKLDRES